MVREVVEHVLKELLGLNLFFYADARKFFSNSTIIDK